MTVNWAKVNDLIRNNLADFPVGDHYTARRSAAAAGLSDVDVEGVFSLYREQIFATGFQVTNGGHRITAMRRQGVRWALGQCYLEDIGDTVPELHAYLP